MKSLPIALVAGLLLALAGTGWYYTPNGQRLEESFGLTLLYMLRGPRESTAGAVIVNIDETPFGQASPNSNFSSWPRTVHAALVDRLHRYGARVIAFDIHFADHRDPVQDRLFAEAIRRAGNVILVEELQHRSVHVPGGSGRLSAVEIETLVPPIPPLADAALALAPFPMPKIPVRVNTTWRFKTSCGNLPTLPVVAFQAASLDQYEQLRGLLCQKMGRLADSLPASSRQVMARGLTETIRDIRELFMEDRRLTGTSLGETTGALAAMVPAGANSELLALLEMYGGDDLVGIDFYGPPASHTTLSYADLLSPATDDPAGPIAQLIRGKVVFVGAAHTNWSNQKDGFYTVYSRPDGLDLSGVELAATVYANLAENRLVQRLPATTVVLLFLAVAVTASLVSFLCTPPQAGLLLFCGMVVYQAGAWIAFSRSGAWTPLIIPLVFFPVVAFVAANLANYMIAFRERRNARTALGFYLPDSLVAEISRDPSFINKADKKVYGTCLITDAQQYTTLSERMSPESLSRHMKEYYHYLFREVTAQNGLVCNVIGDSMLAIWPSNEPDATLRRQGCRAALQICQAVECFNEKYPAGQLPTRIGLHCGYLLMDNIGAADHYEYAPVGDIVNTVSRIEGLNKLLSTQILASEEVVAEVAGIPSRQLGVFLLKGKTRPVTLYELAAESRQTTEWLWLCQEAFPEALRLFRKGQWRKALRAFERCLTVGPEDGPSRFYRQLCTTYLVNPPPADWQGIIRVDR